MPERHGHPPLVFLQRQAHLIGFLHRWHSTNIAWVVGVTADHDSVDTRIRNTAGKAFKRCLHGAGKRLVGRGARDDEIERCPHKPLLEGIGSVNQELKLTRHRVEVNRRRKHNHVGIQHLFADFRNIVILHARAIVAVAGIAPQAAADVFMGHVDYLDSVARLFGATGEFIGKNAGVAFSARASLKNQNVFHHYP